MVCGWSNYGLGPGSMVFQFNLGTLQAPRATAGGRRLRVGLYLTGFLALPTPYICEVNYKKMGGRLLLRTAWCTNRSLVIIQVYLLRSRLAPHIIKLLRSPPPPPIYIVISEFRRLPDRALYLPTFSHLLIVNQPLPPCSSSSLSSLSRIIV